MMEFDEGHFHVFEPGFYGETPRHELVGSGGLRVGAFGLI